MSELTNLSQPFLTEQIITYLGNKRKLLGKIDSVIKDIKYKLDKKYIKLLNE